jgi:hypothetical protein
MREVETLFFCGGSICNSAAGQSTEWGWLCYIKMLLPKPGDGISSPVPCHVILGDSDSVQLKSLRDVEAESDES